MILLSMGCRTIEESRRVTPHPDGLPKMQYPSRFPDDWTIRNQLRIEFGKRAFYGRGVINRHADRMEIAVLSQFGTKILHVVQSGSAVEVLFRAPEISASFALGMIRDVQWIFFIPPASDSGEERVSRRLENFTFTEIFRADSGEMRSRRIWGGGEDTRIEYLEYMTIAEGRFPRRVVLENRRRNYRIDLITEDVIREAPGSDIAPVP